MGIKLTERELADPATIPNPWIGQLVAIRHHISNAQLDLAQSDPELAFEYFKASEQLLQAITSLYAAKNILAGDSEPPLAFGNSEKG